MRAGVSVGTVSHVLNSPEKVTRERRERVEDAIRSLGYQPSQLARGLRTRSTDLLGLILPDIANPFFPAIVRGAEDVAFTEGYRLVICNADNDPNKERSYFQDLLTLQPAGILLIPSTRCLLEQSLKNTSQPVVLVDRCPPWWGGDAVTSQNFEGGYLVGKHLLEHGHRSIGVIHGPADLSSSRARLQGFRRAVKEAGCSGSCNMEIESRFSSEAGHAAALQLLESPERPTAIFAGSDILAAGALTAARSLGLRCPEDLSIVGFDDLEFANLTQPALTTVFQPAYEMGTTACRLLLGRVNGRQGAFERVELATELRIRDSVQRPDGDAGEPVPKRAARERSRPAVAGCI